MNYLPFQYPPNYQLANLHYECSKPGLINKASKDKCPCCNENMKKPLENWWVRDIDKDFRNYGGSVVTYFWLIKYYIFLVAAIIAVYSIYLLYCIEIYCQDNRVCQRFLGMHIVSNQDLYKIIKIQDSIVLVRLFTLRGLAFAFLLFGNCGSLYLVTRFEKRRANKINISSYSVVFKNVDISLDDLKDRIKAQFPQASIKQIFSLYRLQPYNQLSNKRLQVYYQSLIQKNPRKKKQLLIQLTQITKKCHIESQDFNKHTDRSIVVFSTSQTQRKVVNAYKATYLERVKMFFHVERRRLFCEPCPSPEQIIWNNIGQNQIQKWKFKYLSFLYFILLIGGSYLILYGCMQIVYNKLLDEPWQSIAVNIIMIFVVILGLLFRQFMNHLSQMRHPNTQTHRTFFIVLTTLLFHLIYYLIIPTVYFRTSQDKQKSQTLKIISNQAINFMIIQIILAGFDFMYCLWNRKQKNVRDTQNPIGCQKILHKSIEYPRFPIEFKLVILFKFWSFTMFFAFQVPFVLFLILFTLIYLYYKDKHSVYHHYRMQIIDNTVQYQFLKIYSNVFSIYMLMIFLLTQHMEIQTILSVGLTLAAVIVQIFLIKDRASQQRQDEYNDENQIKISRKYAQKNGYKTIYDKFVQEIENKDTNQEIQQYLTKNGMLTLKTEQELNQQLKQ